MRLPNNVVIAIDFDGVVVEERFPKIGPLMLEAKETIRDLYNAGYTLVIWSSRTNEYLDENGNQGMYLDKCIQFLKDNDMYQYFSAVNENVKPGCNCRKVLANWYIDDRNVGGFQGWPEIRRIFLKE